MVCSTISFNTCLFGVSQILFTLKTGRSDSPDFWTGLTTKRRVTIEPFLLSFTYLKTKSDHGQLKTIVPVE